MAAALIVQLLPAPVLANSVLEVGGTRRSSAPPIARTVFPPSGERTYDPRASFRDPHAHSETPEQSTPPSLDARTTAGTVGADVFDVTTHALATRVRAASAAITFTWAADTTPGTAIIVEQPNVRTNSTTATFTIGGTEVAQYQFALDFGTVQGPFGIGEPIMLTDLTEGEHMIAVSGIDAFGNIQSTPTTYTWTVDVTPDVPMLSGVPTSPTSSTTATIMVAGTDLVAYRSAFDSDVFGMETPINTPIALTDLTDGTHILRVIAKDSAGNWQAESDAAAAAWTVDTVAPALAEITPVATPTNDLTPALTIQVEMDSSWELLRGESVLMRGIGTNAPDTVTLPELSDGTYALVLAAVDAAGNRTAIALTAFVIDTTSPDNVSLTGMPPDPTNQTYATLYVQAGPDAIAYRMALDADAFGPSTAITDPIILTNLADGRHSVRGIVQDRAGNWMPESLAITAAWTVDTIAPAATLSGGRTGTTPATTATLIIGGTDVVAYRAALDNADFGPEFPVAEPLVLTSLTDGIHTVIVIGRDAAGNWQTTDTAPTATWLVDQSIAAPPIATPAGGDFDAPQEVILRAPGAVIHYFFGTDTAPTCTNGSTLMESGTIRIDTTATITAVACYDNDVPSTIATFVYRIVRRGGGGGGGGGNAGPSYVFSTPTPPPAPASSAPAPTPVISIPVAPRVVIPSPSPQVLGVRTFANGILLRVAGRDIYLVDGRTLLHIPNLPILRLFAGRERLEVTNADVEGYTRSTWTPPIVTAAPAPRTITNGNLIRVDRRAVYFVEQQTLHRVLTPAMLRRFPRREFLEVGPEVFQLFPIGAPMG